MILAGDIGATKTVLALYSTQDGVAAGALHENRFESAAYSSLEAIISEFLHATRAKPVAASFGVAGPVRDRRAQITNLPWSIDADSISTTFDIPETYLLNDLESIATAVPHIETNRLCTINPGKAVADGNILVIGPGTGLGVAFLVWTGSGYRALASEGGHTSFSPRNLQEMELLRYLSQRYDHVSFERISSGSYLPNIYEFLKDYERRDEPDWLREKLAQASDPTPIIVETALAREADICEETLDIFVQVLGTLIGNMAVTFLPTGGIYLGGGIPPRILDRLKQPDFLNTITDKGRFTELCSSLPVHIILDSAVAIEGAARFGLESLGKEHSGRN